MSTIRLRRITVEPGASGYEAALYTHDKEGWSTHHFTNRDDLLAWLTETLPATQELPPSGSS